MTDWIKTPPPSTSWVIAEGVHSAVCLFDSVIGGFDTSFFYPGPAPDDWTTSTPPRGSWDKISTEVSNWTPAPLPTLDGWSKL
jgi:hypothetical protein